MILRDVRKQFENIINSSNMSIDIIYFVLKDLLDEVEKIYQQEIIKEDTRKITEQELEKKEEDTSDKTD